MKSLSEETVNRQGDGKKRREDGRGNQFSVEEEKGGRRVELVWNEKDGEGENGGRV